MAKSLSSSLFSSSSPSSSKSKTKSHPQPPSSSSSSSSSTHKILTTLLFPTTQKHHTIGRGTPGQGITPWMNSGDLRILGGRRGKLDQVDPESLTSFC
ncbi:1d859efc-2bab-4632-aaa1-127bfcd6b7f0 [Sclerotinia trifoliorum]|uniref:1d859efc-2bab-4632-aaa1-127bfcd6b7f0 n=1 Tax=Sclerotinia trifoliorum TaxID=28548 RepID=A0A8H2ZMW2_9HELO|nr:1d859efc-2bab-4632-aaa1-127bfcd6b7f0 [Sclerotinia trifoliorum]